MLRQCVRCVFQAICQIPIMIFSIFGALFVCCGIQRCCRYRFRSGSWVRSYLYWFCFDARREQRLSCIVKGIEQVLPSIHNRKLSVVVRSGEEKIHTRLSKTASTTKFNFTIPNVIVEQGCDNIEFLVNDGKVIIAKGVVKVRQVLQLLENGKNIDISVPLNGRGMHPPPILRVAFLTGDGESLPLLLGGQGMTHDTQIDNLDIAAIARKCKGDLKKASRRLGIMSLRRVRVQQLFGDKWVLAWYSTDSHHTEPTEGHYVEIRNITHVFRPNEKKGEEFIVICKTGNHKTTEILFERVEPSPSVEAWIEGLLLMMEKVKRDGRKSSRRASLKRGSNSPKHTEYSIV